MGTVSALGWRSRGNLAVIRYENSIHWPSFISLIPPVRAQPRVCCPLNLGLASHDKAALKTCLLYLCRLQCTIISVAFRRFWARICQIFPYYVLYYDTLH